jgi:hypothetical protein
MMNRWLHQVCRITTPVPADPAPAYPSDIAVDEAEDIPLPSETAFRLDDIRPRDSVSQDSMRHDAASVDADAVEPEAVIDVDDVDELENDIEMSEVTCGTSTANKRRRRNTGIAKRHFTAVESTNTDGSKVSQWICLLCRDVGKTRYYNDIGSTTTSRVRHLRKAHKDNPDVLDAYPELAEQPSAPLPVGQRTLTVAYSKDILLEHLVCLIARDNLSIRLVESPQLRALIGLLHKPALRDMPADSSMADPIATVHQKVCVLLLFTRVSHTKPGRISL